MRKLPADSDLDRVRKKLGISRFSLGTFSEAAASRVFDADVLAEVLRELIASANELPGLSKHDLRKLKDTLTAVDGTLLPALPRMTWAL